ncbi:MAG: hypothetical protein P4L56_16220 [Candidatus Sulfopaludibacter sp.]|nr:hypothetical protein [Candidatus Sulfopaludibacter sp.]
MRGDLVRRSRIQHGQFSREGGSVLFPDNPEHLAYTYLAHSGCVEWDSADQQFVQEHPERIHVRGLIHISGHYLGLLRACVFRCADHLPELREQSVLDGPLVGSFCDAEIDHFGNRRALAFQHQHIRRLEVAVDHTLLVRMVNGAAHREKKFQSFADGHPLLIAILRDGYALDVLHDKVRPALACGAGIEDPGDIRVVHDRQRLALVDEAGEHLARVHSQFDDFERYEAANRFKLFGQVDGAHTPLAERPKDPIPAEIVLTGCP